MAVKDLFSYNTPVCISDVIREISTLCSLFCRRMLDAEVGFLFDCMFGSQGESYSCLNDSGCILCSFVCLVSRGNPILV